MCHQNRPPDTEAATEEMNKYHELADDIRAQDAEGKVRGATLAVPVHNQLDVPGGHGDASCWATCDAMWISYLLGDEIDRTSDIAIAVANDMVENGWEKRNSDGSLAYNVPRPWQSTDYVAGLVGLSGVTASQIQIYGNLSMAEIQTTIDSGSPFGVLYRDGSTGHWILGIGYSIAPGHDPLIVSNDPWDGNQRIQTYDEFQKLNDERTWTWTAK